MISKLSTVALATFALAAPAAAADLLSKKPPVAPVVVVSPWDFAVGGKLMSDYNFRGISQSDRRPSVTAYGELRYNLNDMFQVYGGAQGWSVKLPTTPTMELDLYAGVRTTVGAFGLDLGVMRYVYPGEVQLNTATTFPLLTPAGTDFTEVYGKATYTFAEAYTVGANVFYTPNWLGTGGSGTYVSGTAKAVLPMDFAVSGELGRYYLGTTNALLGNVNMKDYTYWNAGLSYTYKFATLDLRYHDTNLNKAQCFGLTTDPRGGATGQSKWCGQAFIATLSFDLTSKDLK
jgi:uncharacterized protein (TIGR02001 family)